MALIPQEVTMPVPSEELVLLNPPVECDECLFSPPPMKHRDTRDSISSTDSDISMTFSEGTTTPPVVVRIDPPPAELSDSGSDSKDSGCDVVDSSEPEFIPPDDEMANKIVGQVEFYFSDVNITKDAFLLKHVKRNKEGYVSLKLISSFKRVKHLSKDWRVVAYALQRSEKLEINEAKTKIRRVDPLPQYDETTPSRTVVALNLPVDKPTIENVAELFSTYGDIALIRILRPGNPVPADVRQFVSRHPEIGSSVCALVEFEKTESARRAVAEACSGNKQDWRGLRIVELAKGSSSNKKTSKKDNAAAKNKENAADKDQQHKTDSVTSTTKQQTSEKKKKRPKKATLKPSDIESSCPSGSDGDDSTSFSRRRGSQPGTSPISSRRSPQRRNSPTNFLRVDQQNSNSRQQKSASLPDAGALSPWVQRRLAAAAAAAATGETTIQSHLLTRPRSNSGATHGALTLPENVVRFPRGPDGTRGFQCGHRERMMQERLTVVPAVC